MKLKIPLFCLVLSMFLAGFGDAATIPKSGPKSGKVRLLIVSSYHKGYEWAMDTNAGLCAALLKFRYFDDQGQIDAFAQNDMIETSRMVMKKLWMDSKKRSSDGEMRETAKDIYLAAREFNPHLILLGDDADYTTAADVAARPGWGDITAVRNGAVIPIADYVLVTRPGPRLVEGLRALIEALHPEVLR